mmetsp:Transcript_1658/g.3152  ORF Transcript_1658/g.3152 Transcript_1658/m.3152 type:complete len:501 (-) Transcript_1658:38-1540(-)
MKIWNHPLLFLFASTASSFAVFGKEVLPDLPSSWTGPAEIVDPTLHEIEYDLGQGPERTHVYVEPNVTTFYKAYETCPASQKVKPYFNGFAAKFINMSPDPLSLYWEVSRGGARSLIQQAQAWQSVGTASFPTHRFIFVNQQDEVVKSFVMTPSTSVYYYDPFYVPDDPQQTEANLSVLSAQQHEMYNRLANTLKFHEQYKNTTGRSYLANFRRSPPRVFMWPADYFGQEHWVTSKETHFTALPPEEKMKDVMPRPPEHTLALPDYRDPSEQPLLNMTLKVLSCAPRVFEIQNFLSPAEVAHLHELAGTTKLHRSQTGGHGSVPADDISRTRTSFNSWLYRERSLILDAIYRRAADLERIDESLMRQRQLHERPDVAEKKSYAEALQLVHYAVGQEYTSHHDFGYNTLHRKGQSVRYTTLIMYLNEPEEGGETTFPRWANAETFQELAVKPETGKAVLFYSQLPDGNLDDLSQHAAKPVIKGEKWMINLWFQNPVYVDED